MKLLFVSGMSGSGKSVALDMLEDLGYYCIDNLPQGLFTAITAESFTRRLEGQGSLAIGIDARAVGDIREFPQQVAALEQTGIKVDVLFLETSNEVLLRRYSETRRKHPLTGPNTHLAEAIARERNLLAPLREQANLIIDTSHTNLHQLRDLIRTHIRGGQAGTLSVLFRSFGFKNGVPEGVDFVFDVRCLPNPHWDPELRRSTGLDPAVVDYLGSMPEVQHMLDDITTFLERWLPRFLAENRAYITVAIGCTGGHHRSVYLAEQLGKHFRKTYEQVLVQHAEIP